MPKNRTTNIIFLLMMGSLLMSVPAAGAVQEPAAEEVQSPQATVEPPDWEDAARREVNDFYAAYWQAWEEKDLEGVSSRLAENFTLLSYVPGQGPVQVGKEAAVASVRQFFAAAKDQQIIWRHSILSVLPRTPEDVIVVVRSDFLWVDTGGQTEVSLEVVQKDAEGRWRIVRKASERRLE
jgi:uncharacterized protein (TIGR02246 family)